MKLSVPFGTLIFQLVWFLHPQNQGESFDDALLSVFGKVVFKASVSIVEFRYKIKSTIVRKPTYRKMLA